jgi:biopolymer transport protein ExbD
VGRLQTVGQTIKEPRDTFFIQLNNRLATVDDIRAYVEEERARMSAEDQGRMVVSLKADRDVPMRLIADIKQALQQSFALRINYSATERPRP